MCGYKSTVCLSALHMGFMFITGMFCHLNTEVHCFGPTPYSSSQILGITLWSVSKPGAQSLRHNLALHLVSAVQKLVVPTFSSGVHVWGTGPVLARVWDLETSIHGLISHIRLCHLVPGIHGLGFSFGTITQLGSRYCSRAQALGSVIWLWVQGKNCSPSSRISVWGPDCGSDICCLSTDGHCLQFDTNGNPQIGVH